MEKLILNDLLDYHIDLVSLKKSMSPKMQELFDIYLEYINSKSVLKSISNDVKVFGFFVLLSQLIRGYYDYDNIHSSLSLSLLYIGKTGDVKSKFFETLVSIYAYVAKSVSFNQLGYIKGITDKDFIFVTNVPTLKQITGGNELHTEKVGKKTVQSKVWRPGVLEGKSFTVFEEFGQILSGSNSESLNILMQLNNAMDKPGYVDAQGISNLDSKGQSNRVYVSSSILMGSTLYKNFYKLDLLNSGFYRRPLFYCNIDNVVEDIDKQAEEYAAKFPSLGKKSNQDYFLVLETFLEEFKAIFYSTPYQKEIQFTQDFVKDMSKEYFKSFSAIIQSKSLSSLHLSFFMNSLKTNTLQLLPIASICASIANRNYCTEDDFKIAFMLGTSSLSSNLKFTENLDFTRKLSSQQVVRKKEIITVRRVISNNSKIKHPMYNIMCISRSELLNELKLLKESGQWDYGYNASLKIIAELVRSGHIHSTENDQIKLPYNQKLYYIKK